MSLAPSQIDSFNENGYSRIDNVLGEEDLNPVTWEFETIIDSRAREMYRQGRLSSICETELFDRRIARLAEQNAALRPG